MPGKRNGGDLNIGGHTDAMVLLNQSPDIRDKARRALHKAADGDEDFLDETIAMLGLYINPRDEREGYSRIPCIVDGTVRTKHKQDSPPTNPPRHS